MSPISLTLAPLVSPDLSDKQHLMSHPHLYILGRDSHFEFILNSWQHIFSEARDSYLQGDAQSSQQSLKLRSLRILTSNSQEIFITQQHLLQTTHLFTVSTSEPSQHHQYISKITHHELFNKTEKLLYKKECV